MHTHVAPARFPDWLREVGADAWPSCTPAARGDVTLALGGKPLMTIDDRFWSATRRIEDMDAAGIDRQVLSPIPALTCYGARPENNARIARFLNDHVAEFVATRGDKFIGMGVAPLQDVGLALAELRYLKETLSIRSVLIGTAPNGKELDSPDMLTFFAACEAEGMAVFVHPFEPVVGRARMNDYYLPNIVGNVLETTLALSRLLVAGVMDRFPKLRICFAHAAGRAPIFSDGSTAATSSGPRSTSAARGRQAWRCATSTWIP